MTTASVKVKVATWSDLPDRQPANSERRGSAKAVAQWEQLQST